MQEKVLIIEVFFSGKYWFYRQAIQDKQKGQPERKIPSGSSPTGTITESPGGCKALSLQFSGIDVVGSSGS